MISYEALRTILTMSITGSIIAIILFALKPFVCNRLPKSAQYYLWLVVLAALVVPISRLVVLPDSTSNVPTISKTVDWYVVSNQDIFERIKPYETESADGFIGIPESSMAEVEALVPDTWVPEAVDWFRLVHFIGVVVYLMFIYCSYVVFTGKLKRRNTSATSKEHAMLAELYGGKRTPLLYRNPLAATPMMIGVFRPAIIMPDREYTNEQLHAVLLHELTHLRRKDVLVKWLSVLVTALHWFNPIVWLVRREIDHACELSCDEAVIRGLDTDGKQNYGETLLYVAADSKTPHAVLSTTMCEEKKALKERLGAIMKSKKHTRLAVIVSAALIVAVGGTAIALGAGSEAASRNNYNFDTFIVSGYKLYGYMDDEAISKLTPTEPLNSESGYAYNFEEIRFDLDDDKCITRFQVNVYDIGIFDMWVQYAQPREDGNGLAFIADDDEILRQIGQVEALIGKGKTGWFDREQRLRYERYTADNGDGEVTFVYTDGEDNGIMNRLVWVIAEGKQPNTRETEYGYDLTMLSKMRVQYIGDASSVSSILYRLPVPDSRLVQQFISIGDDYGTSYAPNTLTVYYEPRSNDVENVTSQYLVHDNAYLKNAVLLFALIDNLDEVTFAVRDTITDDNELHKEAYTSYQRLSRYEATMLIEMNIEDIWDDDSLSVSMAFSRIDEKHPLILNTQTTDETAPWQQIHLGTPIETVHELLGEPSGITSGLWSEFYEIDENATVQYHYREDENQNGVVNLIYLNGKQIEPWQNDITPTAAKWTQNQSLGADNPRLDYAGTNFEGHNWVIFHDYFGLFVYDLDKQEIVYSLDLNAIGCDSTQGDAYCEVTVSDIGDTVTLHPMNSDTMFVLNLWDSGKRLFETPVAGNENYIFPFRTVSIDAAFPDADYSNFPFGKYSDRAVMFTTAPPDDVSNDSGSSAYYGYLYFSDTSLGGICYTVDDMIFELFR